MFVPVSALLISLSGLFLGGDAAPSAACTNAMKIAAVNAELKTIASYSASDAAKIPLDPLASRTFLITPKELGGGVTHPPVNVGVTASTLCSELVALATALNAGVPPSSINMFVNGNGTVTSDFIQTDRAVLPRSSVREIHTFDADCQIKTILGYVRGAVVCPSNINNDVVQIICTDLASAEG